MAILIMAIRLRQLNLSQCGLHVMYNLVLTGYPGPIGKRTDLYG
jgi:hypothetical protein